MLEYRGISLSIIYQKLTNEHFFIPVYNGAKCLHKEIILHPWTIIPSDVSITNLDGTIRWISNNIYIYTGEYIGNISRQDLYQHHQSYYSLKKNVRAITVQYGAKALLASSVTGVSIRLDLLENNRIVFTRVLVRLSIS